MTACRFGGIRRHRHRRSSAQAGRIRGWRSRSRSCPRTRPAQRRSVCSGTCHARSTVALRAARTRPLRSSSSSCSATARPGRSADERPPAARRSHGPRIGERLPLAELISSPGGRTLWPDTERVEVPVGSSGEIPSATGGSSDGRPAGSVRGCGLGLEHDACGDSAGFEVGDRVVDLVERPRFADHACFAGRVKLEDLA
jgi:hypothetical protein